MELYNCAHCDKYLFRKVIEFKDKNFCRKLCAEVWLLYNVPAHVYEAQLTALRASYQ